MMSMTNTDELIVYSNSSNGLGIRILGAKRATHKSGVYIKQLLTDGLAQRDGRLKVGDQILSINDEKLIGINREYAVNILRCAAATNQVRLHIRHFFPPLSSNEYQKFLFDEKSTDDDDDIPRILNLSHNRTYNNNNNLSTTTTTNEVRMRRSSRKSHENGQHRHSAYNLSFNKNKTEEEQILKGLDISQNALQSILNSRFKLIDLIDLLKKTYPKILLYDQKKELQFVQQLSDTNPDGRITLKEFERQSTIFLGERINLLLPFYSSSKHSSNINENEIIVELRREINLYRSTINELENKILTCEKSQRLSEQIEIEYEDLLKFISEQLRQYKFNEINQFKLIQANDQLIQKLFHFISTNINKSTDHYHLSQLKYQYQQQQKILSLNYQDNINDISILSNQKYHQQI